MGGSMAAWDSQLVGIQETTNVRFFTRDPMSFLRINWLEELPCRLFLGYSKVCLISYLQLDLIKKPKQIDKSQKGLSVRPEIFWNKKTDCKHLYAKQGLAPAIHQLIPLQITDRPLAMKRQTRDEGMQRHCHLAGSEPRCQSRERSDMYGLQTIGK